MKKRVINKKVKIVVGAVAALVVITSGTLSYALTNSEHSFPPNQGATHSATHNDASALDISQPTDGESDIPSKEIPSTPGSQSDTITKQSDDANSTQSSHPVGNVAESKPVITSPNPEAFKNSPTSNMHKMPCSKPGMITNSMDCPEVTNNMMHDNASMERIDRL